MLIRGERAGIIVIIFVVIVAWNTGPVISDTTPTDASVSTDPAFPNRASIECRCMNPQLTCNNVTIPLCEATSTQDVEISKYNSSCLINRQDSSNPGERLLNFSVSCESGFNISFSCICNVSQAVLDEGFQCSGTSNWQVMLCQSSQNIETSSTTAYVLSSDNSYNASIKNTTVYIQPDEALSDSTIGIIVGVVLGSATIVVIVVVLAWRSKKQKCIKRRAVAPPKSYLCNDIKKPSSNMTKDFTNKDGTSSGLTNTKEDRTKESAVYSNVVSCGHDNLSFEHEMDNEDGLTYELPDLLKQENTSSTIITGLNNKISGKGVESMESTARSTSKLPNSLENYGLIISGLDEDKVYEDINSDISVSASVTPDPRNRATFPLSNSKTTLNIDQHIYLNALLLEQGLSQTQVQSPASTSSAVSTSDIDPVTSNDDSKTDSVYFELEREDCSDEEASNEEQESHCEDHDYESYSHV